MTAPNNRSYRPDGNTDTQKVEANCNKSRNASTNQPGITSETQNAVREYQDSERICRRGSQLYHHQFFWRSIQLFIKYNENGLVKQMS